MEVDPLRPKGGPPHPAASSRPRSELLERTALDEEYLLGFFRLYLVGHFRQSKTQYETEVLALQEFQQVMLETQALTHHPERRLRLVLLALQALQQVMLETQVLQVT